MNIQDFIVNRDQHMRPLEYDLSENFNELLRYLNDMGVLYNVPVGVTSESEIVSISDAYPAPPRALDVYGKSTQAGTPTPDAPVPILSVDEVTYYAVGKNLFDKSKATSGKYLNQYGTLSNTSNYYVSDYIAITGSSVYLSNTASSGSVYNAFYDANKGFISSVASNHAQPLTVPENAVYMRCTIANANIDAAQVELGSTATTYEPYVGTTVPDLLPEGTSLRSLPDGTRDTLSLSYLRPSTRAGWAWYSRELVQKVSETTVGACSWTAYYTKNFYSSLNGNCRVARTGLSEYLCSDLVPAATTSLADSSSNPDNSIFGRANVGNVIIRTASSYESASVFKAAFADAVILFSLATPVTTQLDPIELPQLPAPTATVWCDGGSAQPTYQMEYVQDTNIVIAELRAALADLATS